MQTKQRKRPPAGHRTPRNGPKRSVSNGDIVYTPPKPFNRNRFLLRLTTVIAVVLAVILGMSIFFKVKDVSVSGCVKYTAYDIKEASGIQEGDNLMTLSRAQVSGKIIKNLPYVDTVRVGIKLPDTVNIEITELNVVYAVQDRDKNWWLMSADGRVVDSVHFSSTSAYTKIQGVTIEPAQVGQQAVAAEPDQPTVSTDATQATEETQALLPDLPVVRASDQLAYALQILQEMESNGIFSDATSVDVSDITNFELWFGQNYQVFLGDSSRLGYKIAAMKAAMDQMGQYQSGVLDVSFTLRPTEVVWTPLN